jgi:hexosaminidase
MVAMSEVLWGAKQKRNWNDFQQRMGWHYDRLDAWEVDYGWETVPIDLECNVGEADGQLEVMLNRAISGVEAEVYWRYNEQDKRIEQPFGRAFELQGEGVLSVNFRRNGLPVGEPWNFPLAGHAGAFRPVDLGHEWSPYYSGGGHQALADGRLGSSDFRDGNWQATQGQNMSVSIALGESRAIDSLSMQFYLYQDAWIFVPDSVRFQWSKDGEEWEGDWVGRSVWNRPKAFERDENQGVVRLAVPVEAEARFVRFEAVNPGPCPDWHDAASSASWLFLDELVVQSKPLLD